jgi:GDP-L-fucose synthase
VKHDNFNIEDGHVIPALIHKFYLAKEKGEHVKIKGSGKPLRQFIYANDLACVILDTIIYDIKFDRVIVSPDEAGEISIDELVRLISKIFDYDNYYYDASADGQYKKTASNKLLMRKIPFGITDYEDGLYETINWFINNYKSIRK